MTAHRGAIASRTQAHIALLAPTACLLQLEAAPTASRDAAEQTLFSLQTYCTNSMHSVVQWLTRNRTPASARNAAAHGALRGMLSSDERKALGLRGSSLKLASSQAARSKLRVEAAQALALLMHQRADIATRSVPSCAVHKLSVAVAVTVVSSGWRVSGACRAACLHARRGNGRFGEPSHSQEAPWRGLCRS